MRIDTFHLNLVKTYNFFLYNEQTSFLWERERERRKRNGVREGWKERRKGMKKGGIEEKGKEGKEIFGSSQPIRVI